MSQKGMDDLKTPSITFPTRFFSLSSLSALPRNQHPGIKQNGVSSAPAVTLTSSTTPPPSFTAVPSSQGLWIHPSLTSPPESSKYVIPMRRPQLPSVSLLPPQPATDVRDVPRSTPDAPPSGSGVSPKRPEYTVSRLSCWACRLRRIKCDKRKAQCTQCERFGRICKWPETVLSRGPKVAVRGIGNEDNEEEDGETRGSTVGSAVSSHYPSSQEGGKASEMEGSTSEGRQNVWKWNSFGDVYQPYTAYRDPFSYSYGSHLMSPQLANQQNTMNWRAWESPFHPFSNPFYSSSLIIGGTAQGSGRFMGPCQNPRVVLKVRELREGIHDSNASEKDDESLASVLSRLKADLWRPLESLEWIHQAKDPTHHFNACENISLPPEESLGPLEWIPQAKDPTPTNHSERTVTSCSPPPKRTLDPLEWIHQAKDPTTASRDIVQLTSPTTRKPGHRQRRNDADNAQVCPPRAARRPFIISWICRMFRVRPRAVEVQQDGESAVPTTVTATSVTPCPSLSTIMVPPSEGHGCSSPSPFPLAAKPSQPPRPSFGPVEWVPQAKDPTTHSGEVAMGELTDATAKHVVPATGGPPTEPAFNERDPPSDPIDGDLVRDLTDLVKRGPRAYRGQYSDVYKGTCGRELVAIKVIKSLPSDPLHAVRRRMRREVGTASRFNHPNVLAVYGVVEGSWGQFGGIVTLWCPNGDACTYLRSARLPPLARLLMVCGVASGLEYIHGQSVVHGDLKPGNILIDALGNPLICDFGLVSILDAEQSDRATDNTTTVHTGTVRYLAYELVQDPPEPRSRASDIHALGCVAYEFLYLEKPYSARTGKRAEFHIFRDIADGVPPAVRPPYVLPSTITSLWSLFTWCWDKEPYQRPSISTFSSALRSLTESDLQPDLSDQ